MDNNTNTFVVEGEGPLHGRIRAVGAKNSAIKLLASALLAPGRNILGRVPRILDVQSMSDVVQHLGASIEWIGPNEISVDVPEELHVEAPYELVRRMRASTAVLGPLLARTGRARVALPGGCDLGPRPIDLHLKALEELGATIHVSHGYLEATCPRLVGAEIDLEYPSHGATENAIMAGVLAEGRTVISNAARDPEINDLVDFLQRMGAKITGAGTPVVEIEGTESLEPARFDVMGDRLEAGTYLCATAAVGGDVTVEGIEPGNLTLVLEKLAEAGAEVDVGTDEIRLRADGRPNAIDISTLPYPGFPTDLYPVAVALLLRAPGLSIVTENIFDGRFVFTDEFRRMGADVRVEGRYVVIKGVEELTGAPVRASDLRAGAALVVAGLQASGRTVIEDVHHIDRGYEHLEERFSSLGASVRRVSSAELAGV